MGTQGVGVVFASLDGSGADVESGVSISGILESTFGLVRGCLCGGGSG